MTTKKQDWRGTTRLKRPKPFVEGGKAMMLRRFAADPDLVKRFNDATPDQIKRAKRLVAEYSVEIETGPGLLSRSAKDVDRALRLAQAMGGRLVSNTTKPREKMAEHAMKMARAIVLGKKAGMILTREFMILVGVESGKNSLVTSSGKSKTPAKSARSSAPKRKKG